MLDAVSNFVAEINNPTTKSCSLEGYFLVSQQRYELKWNLQKLRLKKCMP